MPESGAQEVEEDRTSSDSRVHPEAVTSHVDVLAQTVTVYWLLMYDVVDDYPERRAPYRGEHLSLATDAFDRGELVMAGALADPPDGAVLVFAGDTAEAAESFARTDPYVKNGLVTSWRVRQWTVVVGPGIDPPQVS